ncbi:MAG: DJ-1/PfpI family protein [Nanoarchaeota archaeon]|nr:DJ-1/PfpI family protein [Nanoarchaeota archaeon]
MAKTVFFVIASQGFRDEELFEPLELLKSEGYETKILSQIKGTCQGSKGGSVQSDAALDQVVLDEEVCALIVIGGPGSPELMKVSALGTLLLQAKERGLVIGAICLGPMVVSSFDVISGKKATVFPTQESLTLLEEKGVEYVKEDVVVDGLLVTANGPHAASAFGHTLIDAIADSLAKEL